MSKSVAGPDPFRGRRGPIRLGSVSQLRSIYPRDTRCTPDPTAGLAPRCRSSRSRALAPATFTVTSAGDAGPGTLRQAISSANALAGADRIEFAIGTGHQTIDLLSALPAITSPVAIAGQTQPGFAGSPLIELNGAGAGADADGIFVRAGARGRSSGAW